MPWKEVIMSKVVPIMKNPEIGIKWVEEFNSDEHCILPRSLAIDIISGALECELIAEVLDSLPSSPTGPQHRFDWVLTQNMGSGRYSCSSKFECPDQSISDCYIRIVSLEEFAIYYAGPTLNLGLDTEDLNIIREIILEPAGFPLGDILEWWSGNRDVVWVAQFSEIEELRKGLTMGQGATKINDALGLGKKVLLGGEECELIGIKYPERFDGTSFHQPTTLDSSWHPTGGFFISYGKEDGWGRTISYSGIGNEPSCKERVHQKFRGLTMDFNTMHLGNSDVLTPNRVNLELISRQRLENEL